LTTPTASTTSAGTKNSPVWVSCATIPATRTAISATAASRFTGAGANAAAAASGAGATASSSADQVTGGGSTPTSAEMVISCAAPAKNSAARRHGQLGGAGMGIVAAAALASGELPAGALSVVIGAPGPRVRKIMNIADQASRRTWHDPKPRWNHCQEQVTPENRPDAGRIRQPLGPPLPRGVQHSKRMPGPVMTERRPSLDEATA
jgi:hypothetical protein